MYEKIEPNKNSFFAWFKNRFQSLPVNLTDRVLWGFRTSSLENNSSRRFQFSCHEGRCATNFELEGRLTFHKTHFTILNLQLEDGGFWIYMLSGLVF